MAWWIWLIIGLVLLGLEITAPGGFVLLFFGFGAILTGVLVAYVLHGPPWVEWLSFTVCSVLLLILFRSRLMHLAGGKNRDREVDSLVGTTGSALGSIAPGELGQIELRGASWGARNVGNRPLTPGARCRVTGAEGLKVLVEAE